MNFKEISQIIISSTGLNSLPVGVRFLYEEIISPEITNIDVRLCQAVMEARLGHSVLVTSENIACPAAGAALGLKPLQDKLKSGETLKGYGIFRELEVGRKVMETMPRIELGRFKSVLVKPLKDFTENPDVIVIEDEVEKLMWIALAYLNEEGGRLNMSTSILQAVCVDAVVLPFLSQKINMSFGCYGCRDATDVKPSEAILGIPFTKLDMMVKNLEFLKSKAIDRSRAKQVYQMFTKRIEG